MLPSIPVVTVELLELYTPEGIALQLLCWDKAALGPGMLTLWKPFPFLA